MLGASVHEAFGGLFGLFQSAELKVDAWVGRPSDTACTRASFRAAALPRTSIWASGTRLFFATAKEGEDSEVFTAVLEGICSDGMVPDRNAATVSAPLQCPAARLYSHDLDWQLRTTTWNESVTQGRPESNGTTDSAIEVTT